MLGLGFLGLLGICLRFEGNGLTAFGVSGLGGLVGLVWVWFWRGSFYCGLRLV